MAARVKVYSASIGGLHEWIVAAPNQREAARIWGVDPDIFQRGDGHVTTDAASVKAAMAKPGTALRRLKDTKGAFKPIKAGGDLESWALAAKAAGVEENAPPRPKRSAPSPKAVKPKPAPLPKPAPAKPLKPAKPPDRTRLSKADKALEDFEAEAARQQAALEKERQALERKAAALDATLDKKKRALTTRRDAAEEAWRKAGGEG